MSDAIQKRSFVLVIAAALANLFLLIFSADALLSVVEEVFRGFSGSEALLPLRGAVALRAVLASAFMVPLLVLFPQLPKRAFVPLILFVLWAALGAPPLNLASMSFVLSFGLVLGQTALAALAFGLIKRQTGQYWLSANRLPIKSRLVLRIAVSGAVFVVALVLVLPALILGGLRTTIETETAGYVRLSDTGVELADKTFRKGDRTVRLIGMVHIGEARFYDDLFGSFPDSALVLAEGVSDKDKILENNLSYQRVARVLGLDQQPALRPTGAGSDLSNGGRASEASPLNGTDASLSGKDKTVIQSPIGADVVYADVDLSEFSETTIGFLNETAKLYDSPTLAVAWERLQELSMKYPDPDVEIVMADIVDKRNDKVLSEFDLRQEDYNVIIIPWGALHMPGIEEAITAKGYEFSAEEYRPLIQYDTLMARLQTWGQDSGG